MAAYYNDNDPYVCRWLENLMKEGLIQEGYIDNRSIEDIDVGALDDYVQCHFFAGIGGWAYALEIAGWPEGKKVWTGSCPCQPFSAAGKRQAEKDPRHLWPVWKQIILECKPPTVFGEQVASKDGRVWL